MTARITDHLTYTMRERGPLVPQELDVARALDGYEACPHGPTAWVPTATLWDAYTRWWGANRWTWNHDVTDPDRYPRLTPKQFGRAVRRLFPGVNSC